ncbi:type VII secretion protein EccB [Mycobacterium sp. SP-6446]|uniref:type VII secretion protein EccB n=1 Tax=Mycobacterium sp. SP-6446 TaxID=1834162 RepID=UPI0020C94E72|nr:type VII secretion protein EccB [Mycobacterium sp. SP-6446]
MNYASWEQVSGWRFLFHRLSVAVGRRTVRLIHDPSKNYSAALLVSAVIAVLIVGLCLVTGFFNRTGQIGTSRVLADRASGGLYVEVGGVLHPALNLASARLITGSPDNPKMVPLAEIRKRPIGPLVGIIGAPNDLEVRTPTSSGWALCDRLGSAGSQVTPKVSVVSGQPQLGDWASELTAPRAALMSYGSNVYVVTDGHRSQIDLADRAVTLALGLPGGDLHPSAMSRALYEALTPTAPLRVPAVPAPGAPLYYANAQLPLVSGSVIRAADASGDPQFFVALPAGVQMVSQTVATMIRNAGIAVGAQEVSVPGQVLAALPQAKGFDVSTYPPGRLQLVDKASEPVTCVTWRKGAGEAQAQVSVVTGRRLPIPMGGEVRLVRLVSAGAQVADDVFIGSDSANFVQVTGIDPASPRSESQWLISDNGVRFGVVTVGHGEDQTLRALGLDHKPAPAPWAVIHWLPAGPALSRGAALTEHDTLAPDPSPAPLTTKAGGS